MIPKWKTSTICEVAWRLLLFFVASVSYAVYWLNKSGDRSKLSIWQMGLVVLFSLANPLIWQVLHQPVYGFQYDHYIFVMMPLLVASR